MHWFAWESFFLGSWWVFKITRKGLDWLLGYKVGRRINRCRYSWMHTEGDMERSVARSRGG